MPSLNYNGKYTQNENMNRKFPFCVLFIYLFISLPYKYIIIFEWEQGSWNISSMHLPFATALVGGPASRVDGAYYSELWAPFATVELHLFPKDVRTVFFVPSNFARPVCCEFFITLENYEPSTGVEPGSSRSVVRSSSTALAGPG
jgi:hypothetical protein